MTPPTHPTLRRLHGLDTSSPDFHHQLDNALRGQEYGQWVSNIEDDLTWLVNYLDKTLSGLDSSGAASQECLHRLRSICGARAILPTSYTLSTDHLDIDPDPFARGGCGDVYRGTLNGSMVRVKRVQVYLKDGPQEVAKTFCQEVVMWKRLKHSNVVPLLGITISPFQLISDWMSGGDLPEYIKKNPDADRIGLLSDVAKGLCYLHSCNVIHGDLGGPNILVDRDGHAQITDFGLAIVTQNLDSIRSASSDEGHAVRWTAPEILNEEGTYSRAADIFSFAMVMLEVSTDTVPFGSGQDTMAKVAIMQGRRPARPERSAVTGRLWELIKRCWGQEPQSRPDAAEVLKELLACNPPAWKKLIGHTISTEERIHLMESIFSDRGVVEVFKSFSSDDAQALVDAIDE
ncbi:kinase-like protein [Thelephora ganbajun]|uniref:Kinase-like protein n=1 Tax=Thelephora ganbajun TaxID=370292 RepID=A0ACB6Z522_THEGA|nr:kinase-like protein [Thelephora ganbajun]